MSETLIYRTVCKSDSFSLMQYQNHSFGFCLIIRSSGCFFFSYSLLLLLSFFFFVCPLGWWWWLEWTKSEYYYVYKRTKATPTTTMMQSMLNMRALAECHSTVYIKTFREKYILHFAICTAGELHQTSSIFLWHICKMHLCWEC